MKNGDSPNDSEQTTLIRSRDEIQDRIDSLRDEFDTTRFLTREEADLIRGGKIQALSWVLKEGDLDAW